MTNSEKVRRSRHLRNPEASTLHTWHACAANTVGRNPRHGIVRRHNSLCAQSHGLVMDIFNEETLRRLPGSLAIDTHATPPPVIRAAQRTAHPRGLQQRHDRTGA